VRYKVSRRRGIGHGDVLRFGKYKGRRLQVPTGYLNWMSTIDLDWLTEEAVADEVARRKQQEEAQRAAEHAALFGQAVASGRLDVPPWLPVASQLEVAWERWRQAHEGGDRR
jgi:hypothetical protein